MALLLGVAAPPLAAMPLDPASDRLPLWVALHTVSDPRGEFTPEQVDAMVASGDATGLPHANHAFGKWLPHPYWAQLSLSNPGVEPHAWLLTYELPTQDEVRLWIKDEQGRWAEHPQLESLRPLAPSSGLLYPAWRLQLQAGQTVSLMLRLDGYNLMRFPLFAVRDDAFVLTQGKLHLWIGLVLAVPLVVVLYALTLRAGHRPLSSRFDRRNVPRPHERRPWSGVLLPGAAPRHLQSRRSEGHRH